MERRGSSRVASRIASTDVNIEREDMVADCSTPSHLLCKDHQALLGHPGQGMCTSTILAPACLHRPILWHSWKYRCT